MKDEHPIDKLFKDGLQAPETPFDPEHWEKLSQKMRPRRERKIPALVWIASGVAAALVLAGIWLLQDRQTAIERPHAYTADQTLPDTAGASDSARTPDILRSPEVIHPDVLLLKPSDKKDQETETLATEKTGDHLRSHPVDPVTVHKPTTGYALHPTSLRGNQRSAVAHTLAPDEPPARKEPRKGWVLSVIAAPDLSGIQPFSGDVSGNVGILATYRINRWLSLSGGALYALKAYQADYHHYRPDRWRNNGSVSPGFVIADCAVLDVPLLANATIKRFRRSDFFVSTGISSYFMLRETYDYRYPPEAGRDPWELTVRNQNRHLLGVGNFSVGYRRQLTPAVSLTVQPFVKVPLTGIGNGHLKLYSTGVALSADIDLTRRAKR